MKNRYLQEQAQIAATEYGVLEVLHSDAMERLRGIEVRISCPRGHKMNFR